eukprot:2828337-Prymnesium_polylepis.1
MILGDEVEIKRAARGAVIKRKGTHVNLEVQQENKAELAVWGARLDPSSYGRGPECASRQTSNRQGHPIGPGVVRSMHVYGSCGQGAVARGRQGERGATFSAIRYPPMPICISRTPSTDEIADRMGAWGGGIWKGTGNGVHGSRFRRADSSRRRVQHNPLALRKHLATDATAHSHYHHNSAWRPIAHAPAASSRPANAAKRAKLPLQRRHTVAARGSASRVLPARRTRSHQTRPSLARD